MIWHRPDGGVTGNTWQMKGSYDGKIRDGERLRSSHTTYVRFYGEILLENSVKNPFSLELFFFIIIYLSIMI